MGDAKLLPCPFCGGAAGFEECAQGSSVAVKSCTWSVGCMNSQIDCIGYQMLASFDRKADAAEAWNKRAMPWRPINSAPVGDDDFYLVCCDDPRDDRSPFVVRGSIFASSIRSPTSRWHTLTHWMPLPLKPHATVINDDQRGEEKQ